MGRAAVVGLAFLLSQAAGIAAAHESLKPDILLIMPDQMRGDCLSCLGRGAVRTPQLDELAEQGVLRAGLLWMGWSSLSVRRWLDPAPLALERIAGQGHPPLAVAPAAGKTSPIDGHAKDVKLGHRVEDLLHIFERFLREEEPRSARVFDTGLRLMIMHEIVALHDGWVTVESGDREGTTFTIWLPLTD